MEGRKAECRCQGQRAITMVRQTLEQGSRVAQMSLVTPMKVRKHLPQFPVATQDISSILGAKSTFAR